MKYNYYTFTQGAAHASLSEALAAVQSYKETMVLDGSGKGLLDLIQSV